MFQDIQGQDKEKHGGKKYASKHVVRTSCPFAKTTAYVTLVLRMIFISFCLFQLFLEFEQLHVAACRAARCTVHDFLSPLKLQRHARQFHFFVSLDLFFLFFFYLARSFITFCVCLLVMTRSLACLFLRWDMRKGILNCHVQANKKNKNTQARPK